MNEGRPIQFAQLVAHSLSILGVALDGRGRRHPHPPLSPPLPRAAYPTHPRLLPETRIGSGRGGRRAGGRTPILMQRIRRKERPKDFRAGRQTGIIMQHNGGRRKGGRRKRNGKGERERERGVLRTMQRFFYDERTNEAKGEEDDRHV